MTKSGSIASRADVAAWILPTASSSGMQRRPATVPDFFGASWSSMLSAATPDRTSSRTAEKTFTALPKPVSASTKIGMSVRAAMWRA